MSMVSFLCNSAWFAANALAQRRFAAACASPRETQLALLQRMLRQNASCAFGREHGFAELKSYGEFARHVPVRSYEEIAPWIKRIAQGEEQLLTSEPVTHLVPTSGSTSGRKLIPFTRTLQSQFDAAIAPWINDLFSSDRRLLTGCAYWSLSPSLAEEKQAKGAVRIGFETDAEYLGGPLKKWLAGSVLAVPAGVSVLGKFDEWRFVTLCALLRRGDLRLISVWHPSFLELLLDAIPERWTELLKALAGEPPANLSRKAAGLIRRASAGRLRALEAVSPAACEALWPGLRLVSCWGDGAAEGAFNELKRRASNVRFQAKGLLATEGVVTFPFRGRMIPALTSHFLEFVDAHGKPWLADELRAGERYEVVLTTGGGLWRYRLADLVEVEETTGSVPSLRFVARAGRVLDLCGEKLSEAHVAEAIRHAAGFCHRGLNLAFLAPAGAQHPRGYILFAQGDLTPNLAEALDERLRENPHYDYCRKIGQLAAVRLAPLPAGANEMVLRKQTASRRELGNIKPSALCEREPWLEELEEEAAAWSLSRSQGAPL